MKHNEIAAVYREVSTRGSHPVALVVKLYDAILEDFRRAMNAVETGDIQARTASLNHALQVIAELQSVLDHERGGEISRRLNGFYDVTRPLIVEANIHSKPHHIQRLIDLYTPLRQAWRQVDQDASAGKLQTASPSAAAEQQAEPATVSAGKRSGTGDSEISRGQWNA